MVVGKDGRVVIRAASAEEGDKVVKGMKDLSVRRPREIRPKGVIHGVPVDIAGEEGLLKQEIRSKNFQGMSQGDSLSSRRP